MRAKKKPTQVKLIEQRRGPATSEDIPDFLADKEMQSRYWKEGQVTGRDLEYDRWSSDRYHYIYDTLFYHSDDLEELFGELFRTRQRLAGHVSNWVDDDDQRAAIGTLEDALGFLRLANGALGEALNLVDGL